MKNICRIIFPLIFVITAAEAQVTLTAVDSLVATPNGNDTIGAFARIFHHQPRNKFYLVYAARLYAQPSPAGVLNKFAWLEYDANLSPTGNSGYLPNHNSAGDFAMLMIDSTYYHLTVLNANSDYLLSKYDDDFNLLDTAHITLDACDSNIDQLMNYTNGRLLIGAMQETSVCPPTNPPVPNWVPYSHIFQYDPVTLAAVAADVVTTPSNICWGSSMIYNAGSYYHITMNNFNNHQLYAYQYDASFNYQSQTLLSNDGQWSQGLIWDAPYYYVAYHTGDHNRGNVLLGVYDASWNSITTINVSNFPIVANGYNANRPYITKVGNLLYISYDVESYINAPPPVNQKDWQAHVKVYQVSVSSGVPQQMPGGMSCRLFPNPAAEYVDLICEAGAGNAEGTVSVMDVFGKEVLHTSLQSGSTRLYCGDLPGGVYSIVVLGKDGTAVYHSRFTKTK